MTEPTRGGDQAAAAARHDGRTQLITAAERLFAEKGIYGVSLRQINAEAGQRNKSALQYHFGDRAGLVRAVVDKHRAGTEPIRNALLDEYEAAGARDLWLLSAALVEPLAAKLSDADGGRHYLQINRELFTSVVFDPVLATPLRSRNSIKRWHDIANDALPDAEGVLHFRFPAIRFAFVELARRAAEPPRRDDRLFTSHLVDMVASLLATRPSASTSKLLDERATRRKPPGGGASGQAAG